jgi:Fanconi anemia group M protein
MEYVESQGASVAFEYLKNILESDDNSIKRTARILAKNPVTVELLNSLEKAAVDADSNPKLKKTLQLCDEKISSNPDSRIIVSTHFRKTATIVNAYLEQHSSLLRPVKFVGQASKEGDAGMSQKEQDDILSKFRTNIFNVLVATSVAEEGLDIPSTDLVIFFEPVPSEIRTIQRRGRTGRLRAGDVYILMYSGTRDAGYYYSSRKKEATMGRNIEKAVASIERNSSRKKKESTNLDDFF